MPKKSGMLASLEAKLERKYQLLFHRKMHFLLQMAQDAAMIAAHDVLKMGKGRAADFVEAYRRTIDEMSAMTVEDAEADKGFEYTKAKVDEQLKQICGERFEPWEVRYGEEN